MRNKTHTFPRREFTTKKLVRKEVEVTNEKCIRTVELQTFLNLSSCVQMQEAHLNNNI